MFRKSTREEQLGCLGACLGVLAGMIAANIHFAAHVAEIRAKDPEAFICGLPFVPVLFFGMLLGGLTGAVVGMSFHYLLPTQRSKGRSSEDRGGPEA